MGYPDIDFWDFIKDNKNIEEPNEVLRGQDLIAKITNADGSMNYDSWLITDCGYELFDKDDVSQLKIFESPDGGKTVYERNAGDYDNRKKIKG